MFEFLFYFYLVYRYSVIKPVCGNKTFHLSLRKFLLSILTSVCSFTSSEVEGEIRYLYTWLGWVIIGVDSAFIQVSGHNLPILNASISSNRIIKTINFNGSCFNVFSIWMLKFISFPKGQHRLMMFLIKILC